MNSPSEVKIFRRGGAFSLTTIAPPKQQMGKLAVQMVHAIRTHGEAGLSHYTMMESPLIVRESTALCRNT